MARTVTIMAPSGAAAVSSARDELASRLARGRTPITIDIGTIGMPDLPMLQVICAAHKRAIDRGVDLCVLGDGQHMTAYVAEEAGFADDASCGIAGAVCPWAQRATARPESEA